MHLLNQEWPTELEEVTKADKHAVDAAEEEATSEEEEETPLPTLPRKN